MRDPIETPSAVHMAAKAEWNERYGSHIAQARNWRRAAFAGFAVAGIAVGSACWLAAQARVVPYVVEVNKLGEALTVKRLGPAPTVDTVRIKAQLARWIFDVRTVWIGPLAQKQLIDEAAAWTDRRSAAYTQLMAWYSANPPIERAQNETVTVQVENITPLPDGKTWQIDWKEVHHNLDGTLAGSATFWRALVSIVVSPPTADTITSNPNGLFIERYSISERNS